MNPKTIRQARRNVFHQIGRTSIYTINKTRKIQGLLKRPYGFMLVGGQNLCRVTDSDPSDRHGRARFQSGSQVHGSVDANFGPAPDLRPVKYGCPGGDENFPVDLSTNHVAVRTDDAMVPNGTGMATGGADHRGWSRRLPPPGELHA